jgi:hypothetical protein
MAHPLYQFPGVTQTPGFFDRAPVGQFKTRTAQVIHHDRKRFQKVVNGASLRGGAL